MVRVPEVPYRPTMPESVRRAASTFGDDDYVVLPDRRLSFDEAEAASRLLAKQLLAAGIGKGSRIGIHLTTGPEWAVAFIAVTRIGALALPFSSIYRPAELRTAMRVGDVELLLSSATTLGKDHESYLEEAIPGLATASPGRFRLRDLPYLRSVWLLGDSARTWTTPIALEPQRAGETIDGVDDRLLEAIEAEVTPGDDMFLVFTSGTTAEPKGVLHTQGALLRKTAPVADAALNAIFGGRVLCLMPFFWIGGLQEVTSALHSGAAVLTLERLDAAAALELGRRERATSIQGNPQALRSLLGDTNLEAVIPSLSPLPRRPWEGQPSSTGQPPAGLGMTETIGVWAAIDGFEYRVVDPETGDLLGDGEVGEFEVRGYGLMRGLYKREREEVFRRDGYYRTGDVGYVEKGQVYFTSRLKELIKTKGANVAPAEVEAVLNARSEVRMSFVLGLPHASHGEEVVAGVVPEDGHEVDVEVLLEECRRMLSAYKVPRTIEVLAPDDITYLASSKPDRRAVAEIVAERIGARRSKPASTTGEASGTGAGP